MSSHQTNGSVQGWIPATSSFVYLVSLFFVGVLLCCGISAWKRIQRRTSKRGSTPLDDITVSASSQRKEGFSLSLCSWIFFTAKLNAPIWHWVEGFSPRGRKVLSFFFSTGTWAGLILFVASPIVLTGWLGHVWLDYFYRDSSASISPTIETSGAREMSLRPNLLTNLASYAISAVLHEAGHGVTAMLIDSNRFQGFGVYISCFIIFGAFVRVIIDDLSVRQKLGVICGGIWVNFCLAFLSISCVHTIGFIANLLLSPGVTVIDSSPLLYQADLRSGDAILSIDNCPSRPVENGGDGETLKSALDFHACLDLPRSGRCMPSDLMRLYNASVGDGSCCPEAASSHLCFSTMPANSRGSISSCLPARLVTERATCMAPSDCPTGSSCLLARLQPNIQLVPISRDRGRLSILYLGTIAELKSSLRLSSWSSSLPYLVPFVHSIMDFLWVLANLSFTIGFINVMPSFGLDGYHIASCLVEGTPFFKRNFSLRQRRAFVTIICVLGSLLLAIASATLLARFLGWKV